MFGLVFEGNGEEGAWHGISFPYLKDYIGGLLEQRMMEKSLLEGGNSMGLRRKG